MTLSVAIPNKNLTRHKMTASEDHIHVLYRSYNFVELVT
jgi:hypothetical protein